MKATRKQLSIDLEFTDIYEAEMALRMIMKDIKTGSRQKRHIYLTTICDWSCTTLRVDDYREELVDGQWVRIYQSRLNNK